MDSSALQLDQARSLLRQAGVALPAAHDPPTAQEVQAIIDGLCLLSQRDALTGLPNRRAFEARARQELDRASRAGETPLLLLVDLDHFKMVNDRHGHAAGDAVLRTVAQALQRSVRPMDTVARLGGEEFAVLLPHVSPPRAAALAERVRAAVAAEPVTLPDGRLLPVTASVGGALAPPWVRTNLEHWLERADRQLYAAKAGGRNRVSLEGVAHTEVSAEEKNWLLGWMDGDGRMIADAAEAEPDVT
ncbi:Response regulator PleD [Tepidimonas sediminis]|uniref:diguanylate cyclase n=1 Tax=Tepidimonas sediminis TaxID=2588941 RepID=A0A554WIR0_9BURK|nr:GGDEF domain-containing protein [Tepidimonas sediminis]TSE23458.1 Response regulator PleD [Tepidimonas sediminis]